MRTLCLAALLAFAGITAQPAGAALITILAPAQGAELSGVVEVRASVALEPGEDMTPPVAQAADGWHTAMSEQADGTYSAEIDTAELPNGRQPIMVFMAPRGTDERREGYDDSSWAGDKFIAVADVSVLVRNPYRHYWGDLHAHTSYSDGAWLPGEAYDYARSEAGLDFFAVTDHLEILTFEEYATTMIAADAADEPGIFVALYGVERTRSDTGHINFFMSPTHVLPYDLSDFYRALGHMGLLGHFNHPRMPDPEGDGRGNDFEHFRYAPEADASMAMVEVRDAREEACYIALLDNGWHVGAAGCEDKHDPTWGQGDTWTVALARELTRESILEALWSRRTYSAADRNLELDFTLDGEDMGAQVSRPAGQYACRVSLCDPDADHRIQKIDLILDGEVTSTVEPGSATYQWEAPVDLSAGQHYCFVRVTQTDERMTWSSPVWVTAH